MDNSTATTRSDCRGRHYCGHWRTCERCARIRAARIADRAEYLEQRFGKLALAVAKPEHNTQASMKALRDKITKARLAPAGIWTIETGELFAGLHLNLLVPATAFTKTMLATQHIEVIRESSRAAAAYIAKRTGMPTEQQYGGRLFGEWGTVTQHLMKSTELQAAPSQAAALQMALGGHTKIADYYKTIQQRADEVKQQHEAKKEKTRDEYAAIMRRNLSAVYMALGNKLTG